MFAITKLSKDSQTFLGDLALNNKGRSVPVSIALGRTLATSLSLPSSPVENVTLYYQVQHSVAMNQLVNDINEIIVLDVHSVYDYIAKFYQLRYQSAYPDQNILVTKKETAIVDFFKISKVINKETIDVIEADPILMTKLVNGFNLVFSEMKA